MPAVPIQVQTARKTGLLFPDLPRGVLSVRGKDRSPFLHRLLSNDIKGLQSGQAKPACLLDRQGKILFCCNAHARPEEILLEMDPSSLPAARDALERYVVADAVEFEEATARFRVLSAHGPAVAGLKIPVPSGGFETRNRLFGMPGLDLWLPASDAGTAQSFAALCAGAGMGTGETKAFEVLCIEAGVPLPGREITPEVILNELGRDEFVSFTKGCYVGQEIVARIKHRAHPPRLLSGFVTEGSVAAAEGSPILLGGEPAGVVTSSCFSPTLGKPIALGFLKYGVEGETFLIQNLPARKAGLPFVSGSS